MFRPRQITRGEPQPFRPAFNPRIGGQRAMRNPESVFTEAAISYIQDLIDNQGMYNLLITDGVEIPRKFDRKEDVRRVSTSNSQYPITRMSNLFNKHSTSSFKFWRFRNLAKNLHSYEKATNKPALHSPYKYDSDQVLREEAALVAKMYVNFKQIAHTVIYLIRVLEQYQAYREFFIPGFNSEELCPTRSITEGLAKRHVLQRKTYQRLVLMCKLQGGGI